MTIEQSIFTEDVLLRYIKESQIERDKGFISRDNHMVRRYIQILKRIYAKIILNYFNVFSLDDVNFCTEEEIQLVIDRYNQLCNTDYTVDTEIVEVTSPTLHIWDDNLYWDDSAIWED